MVLKPNNVINSPDWILYFCAKIVLQTVAAACGTKLLTYYEKKS